jgi:hypothetical protein
VRFDDGGRQACWNAVWARPQAGKCRRCGSNRSRTCIGPATAASPPSTSTSNWCVTTGFSWGYTWTKVFLQSKGLQSRAKTRGAHRRKRPRRPLPGMMLHQDGSGHEWIAGLKAMDLIVTMDDATNTIYSGLLVPKEGTASTFQAPREVFGRHGLPLSLCNDRVSHYFFNPVASSTVDRESPTQVGRALAQLGCGAHRGLFTPGPWAVGASVRNPAGPDGEGSGVGGDRHSRSRQRVIRDVNIPAHKAWCAVKPEQAGSTFVAITGVDLAEILCVQEERQVGNDDTQQPAHGGGRIVGLVIAHEPEPFAGIMFVSRANQAATFGRISRSSLSWRFSCRSRLSSSRSAIGRPPSPRLTLRSRCNTPIPDPLHRGFELLRQLLRRTASAKGAEPFRAPNR